ncbi:MAG: hypothetical protein U9M98_03035 [Patescibacteria group bacterium]|nr:hypothetical protein [Patescibacteria group bacterium]
MNRITKFLTNTALASMLVILILGPIGVVGYISGMDPTLEVGTFLGARINSKGEVLQKIKEGISKKIAVKTFWGQQATYKRAISLKNNTNASQTYQIEIMNIEGKRSEDQDIVAYFSPNQQPEITLDPKQSCWIDIIITAPSLPNLESSLTQITLTIWTL